MKVWHLFHSGVLIETESKQFFFDVITDITSLVDLSKDQYFFVSHSHGDHFSKVLLEPYKHKAYYILSDEASIRKEFQDCVRTLFVKPNEIYDMLPFKLSTHDSTDLGVSFLVEIENKIVFHSGDLNWWHWENATEQVQLEEARQFKEIVDGIKGKRIDVLFVPVDPRLKAAYYYAADYFLSQKDIQYLVPMHFDRDYKITERLSDLLKSSKVIRIEDKNTMILEIP